jgi:hypothetical protein
VHFLLQKLTAIACDTLRDEDNLLRGSACNNASYINDKRGILLFNYERYFQCLIARNFLASFSHKINLEWNYHDLVLTSPTENESIIIEMKRWMSGNGKPELPKMRYDIHKLRTSKLIGKKILMVFSVNPLKSTESNLKSLLDELNVDIQNCAHQGFNTFNEKNIEVEFWVSSIAI